MQESLRQMADATGGSFSVASFLFDYVRAHGLTSFELFCEALGLSGATPGYNGSGTMAFARLAKNEQTGGVIVLAAMKECAAPPHLHRAGECTFTLIGTLRELGKTRIHSAEANDAFSLGVLWPAGSFHQPWTESFWAGVYEQPGGMIHFDRMGKDDLAPLLHRAGFQPTVVDPSWDSLDDAAARAVVFKLLGLNGRSR